MNFYRFAYFSLVSLGACMTFPKEHKAPDPIIASVYEKKLFLSDLSGMFSPNATKEDSLHIINNYVNRWTKEQVFLSEAEKHIPKDLEIEELLKKYKESLIALNFQQQLSQENLDSLVTEEEIREFYEKNKDQYQLETSIIRCYFVKVPDNIKEIRNVKEWWDDLTELNKKKLAWIADRFDEKYNLVDSVWHDVKDIEALFPKNKISTRNWTNGESLSFSDNKYVYFFKVLELVSKQETAPISYVAEKAKLIILNKRKNRLIEEFKTKLYETELRKNNVKILYQ
ncbi:MAG: hypothetical protein ABIR66_00690 [Saprospiraceae bacterium]